MVTASEDTNEEQPSVELLGEKWACAQEEHQRTNCHQSSLVFTLATWSTQEEGLGEGSICQPDTSGGDSRSPRQERNKEALND